MRYSYYYEFDNTHGTSGIPATMPVCYSQTGFDIPGSLVVLYENYGMEV